MFKRVTKRGQKREKEKELGLDEDMKQILGLQDTDSDESLDSSSDSESDHTSDGESDTGEDFDDEDANRAGHLYHKENRPRPHSDGIREESEYSDVEGDVDGEDENDDEDDEGPPPMSVIAATTDPIYDLPNLPPTLNQSACIICPGKVIKNPTMAKTHLESTAHRRRLQRYTAEVSKRTSSEEGLNTDDPRDILRDMSSNVDCGAPVNTSNRSQRRVQWKNKQAERRKSRKEKGKLAMDKSKEMDLQKSDHGGTTKKVNKAKNDGSKTGVSGVLPTVESTCDPKPANLPRHKESVRSRPIEPTVDNGQHGRPKKRQKRYADSDV